MNKSDIQILIDSFKGYRDLLSPIQKNLSDFVQTFEFIRFDIEKLNTAFEGDMKGNLDKIYKNLSRQAEQASDLFQRIDTFVGLTEKYTQDVTRLVDIFEKVEKRIKAVNELEQRAEEQIARLDELVEEKKKSYNIKELQRTLENYNANVQKVSEFINKDVAESLNENYKKLESIKRENEVLSKRIEEEHTNVEILLTTYTATNELLKKITEKQDVNQAYIFDILDKWAEERKIKTKKK
ncbi:MAG: hypothetical protein QM214_04770 [Bacillota bacterium]|jgi:uncharacterized protein YukE|nr:hypothetical protein [Bacillota bacterium]HHU43670.1 hypothetical protein [Clostridiales bacterium]